MRLSYAGNRPVFPGFEQSSRAPYPVWKGAFNITKKKVKPARTVTRDNAPKWLRHVERFEGQTRQPGKQDGAIGRNGVAVARAMVLDFMNWKTGRLDPSYESIAKAANISVRSVARGIQALRRAGVLHWVRRCIETTDKAGRFALAQISNLYAFKVIAEWIGYTPPDQVEASELDAIALGLVDPMERGSKLTTTKDADYDPEYDLMVLTALAKLGDPLSVALASWGRGLGCIPSTSSEMPDRL